MHSVPFIVTMKFYIFVNMLIKIAKKFPKHDSRTSIDLSYAKNHATTQPHFSNISGFLKRFFAHSNCNVLVESVFAPFWHF